MEDLKQKWQKLSLFGSKKSAKGFKGTAHKLGTSDSGAQSTVDQQRAVRPASPASLRSGPPRSAPPQAAQSSLPAPSAVPTGGRRLGSTSTQAAPEAVAAAPSQPKPQHRMGFADSGGTTTSSAEQSTDVAEPPSEQIEAAAALLRSDDRSDAAIALLNKVMANIVGHPSEQKYRRLRLQNRKVQQELVDVSGGIEFLQAAGFQLVFEEDGGQTEGYAVFPEDEDLGQLLSALVALALPQQEPTVIDWSAGSQGAAAADAAMAAPAAAAGQAQAAQAAMPLAAASAVSAALAVSVPMPTSAAQPAERRERQTQVLLPDNPSTEVSEEVFKRTPVDVKSSYLAARKQLEQGQMLMTREYRAKLAAGSGTHATKKPAHGVIRVRLPDGLVLQGEFNAGEQVSRIFEWVSDALRDPGRTYELIDGAARRPLTPAAGTVTQADLLPTCMLNFRWAMRHKSDEYLPPLRDEWLARARLSSAA